MSAVPGPQVDLSPTTTASPTITASSTTTESPATTASPATTVSLTTTACPTLELSGPFNMHYYLTEGLEGVEHQKYRGGASFTTAIESKADELRSVDSNGGQYVVFSSVEKKNLAYISRIRNTQYKGLRFLYLETEKTLIVKTMFRVLPGLVSARLVDILRNKIVMMGLDRALLNVGRARFEGGQGFKEAYCGLKPTCLRSYMDDWPTLVLECGISESKRCLRADASWWLQNSQDEVKIVLVVKVSEGDRKIKLEQWEMDAGPNPHATRARPGGSRRLIRTQKVTIVAPLGSRAVATAPFSFNFNKIFLRDPDPAKGEKDIIFSKKELEEHLAEHVWNNSQKKSIQQGKP